ncbi:MULTISPECIES: BglG family transcription antiterminator [unclassified Lacticaseibacillus]|uniref:BglG family transcription antiterminator n=1 Tax=unclassified Lacticaseibacillus TaxID=2759744 RepID=UPI00194411AC|nr:MULTISPECIES: BglG family transcription antiterminator [unclassified Lacticaseibacillus]
MDSREMTVLHTIVSAPDVTSTDILSRLGITRRQLDYSIKKINKHLKEINLPQIKRTRNGAFVIGSELLKYLASLEADTPNSDGGVRYRDETQRMFDIIFYVLVCGQYISLNHLFSFLNVGKTTVTQDLKGVANYLEERGLQLSYDRQNGYRILGPELKIRILLLEVTTRLQRFEGGQSDIEALVIVNREDTEAIVAKAEKALRTDYSDRSRKLLISCLQASISRLLTFHNLRFDFEEPAVANSIEYTKLRDILPENWYHTESDFQWLVLIFLTSNTWYRDDNTLDEDFSLAVDTMIHRFEEITYSTIDKRSDFRDKLIAHLQPAYYRVKYGMPLIENTFSVGDEDRSILIDIVREIIKPIEKLAGKRFPNNELQLIAYYFGLVLDSESGQQHDAPHFNQAKRLRAGIVSNAGIVETRILYAQLAQTFPEIELASASSVRDFNPDQSQVDLVFSTVPLTTKLKQFIIPTNMSRIQQLNLRYRVLREMNVVAIDDKVNKIVAAVSKNANIIDMERLRRDIQRTLLSDETRSEPTELPALAHYLSRRHIVVKDYVADWKTAIAASAEKLLKDGCITAQYIQRITRANAGKDAYSFLGKRMAIPHADSEGDVKNDGFGILVLKQPTVFPNGMKVSIVVTLAVAIVGPHIKAINQLAEIALDSHTIKKIVAAKDADEVYEVLINEIKE